MGTPMRTTPRNAIIFALLAGTWGQPHTRRLEDATTIAPTAYEACSYVPDACVFPFTYLGVEYQTCTDVGAGATFWCSTTASYQFGASEDCGGCVPPTAAPTTAAPTTTTAPSNQPTATVAPTADATTIAPTAYEACTYVPDACVFPFTYLGVEYQTCTDVGAGAAFWCSTTASYQFGASEDCAGCVLPSAAPSPPPSAARRRRRRRDGSADGDAPSPAPTPRPTRRCATTTFSERVIYDQATYALHGFVADVDGDGDLDALSAAEGDGALCGTGVSEVAWYENDGAMSFAHRTVSDAREMARQVFAVDVDGDGDVDVLSASLYDDTIAWHENDGLQSFAERLISTLASAARTVYAADVDGDGDVDAVAGSGSDDTVEWFENDGSQSFSGSIITSRVLVPYDVKVLDVDGDADVDVMCASGYMDEGLDDYVLNWFENDGFQSFTTREMSNQPPDAVTVYAADVDGDGDVDAVAALPGDDAVAWFENVGNYIFLQRVVVLENVDAWGVAAHDVDGDGDLDLLTAIYWNHKFAWYENDGAQSFVEHTLVESNGGQTNLGGARGAYWVGAADLDGDGDADIVGVSGLDCTVRWWEHDCGSAAPTASSAPTAAPSARATDPTRTPTPRPTVNCASVSFAARYTISGDVAVAQAVSAADVDGDGDIDPVAASNYDDGIAWYENDGAQSFSGWDITKLAAGARAVFAIDVDRDGDVDLLAASENDDTVAWYENDGSGVFTEHLVTTLADGADDAYAIDVDGDGDVDFLSANFDIDTVAWYENDGSEAFTAHAVATYADGPESVFAVDVDGDGDVDVLSASSGDNTVAWYENGGAEETESEIASLLDSFDGDEPSLADGPSFQAHAITNAASAASSVFAIDVDGDGDVDALSTSKDDDTVAWYENDGSQSFSERVITDAAAQARSVFAIDVDGDGDVDALSASENDDTVAWYENDGEESFVAHIITTVADGACDVFAIDVDGDGDVDALSASINDDTVAWYENDCGTSSPTATPAPSRPPTAAPSATPTSPAPSTPPTEAPTAAPTAAPTHALCPAGSYSGDRSAAACEPCAPGTYANGTGAYACDICPVNTYAVGGAAECAACPAGRQSGLGSDGCGYCLEGQYQTLDADSNKLCIDCDAGWYSPVGLTCAACGPGLYTPDGVQCVYCESGRFSNGTANEGCADCPAGAAAESGASACAPCAAEACDNATETCDQGSYGHAAAAASCLACPYPLVATRAAATFCDGCAAGTYWSDAVHDAWLAKGYRHEDGSQCVQCCRTCVAGMACDVAGLDSVSLRIDGGYWRGSAESVEVYDCANRGNCPGSGAAGALGGDDLCAGHSEGVRCNECERGFYRGADGDCFACGGSSVALVAFFATAAVLAAGAYAARPYVARVSFGHWDWWLTTAMTLWYAAQSNVIFFKIEELSTPAPFKYVLDALDVFIFEHFRCDGPYELSPGRKRRVLAVDYGVSCDSATYALYSWYMSLALAFYFYWVEVVDVFERLTLCGLTVFLFPSRAGMRVACCVLFLVFRLWLSATYKPIVNDAHRAVSLACVGYLAVCVAVAVMNLPETPPTALQETCFSSLLLAACAGVGLLARAVAARERVHALLDRIHRRAPFDRADFEAAYGAAAAAKELQGAAVAAACAVIRAPTAASWAYLKAHLQPLPVWADAPAIDVLARCAPSFDDDVAARATGEGPIADDAASSARHGRDARRPWEAFRLVALWAMHGTKAEMDRRCAAFLALEPYGDYLRAERDVKADLEQPLLRRAEVAAVTDLVARGPQTARFLAEVDRLCFPELLKALSTAAFDELEAHFRELLPGIRTFVHDDGGGEPAAADDPPPRRAPSAKALWATSTSWSNKGVASEKGAPAADLDRDAVDRLDAPGALPGRSTRRACSGSPGRR
ncbi:hypothetical protein JL721_4686 [Aureococcus anophagefferens]|nr:hypothetical protein JL721_4686 [Aureococcus anophagefferens]